MDINQSHHTVVPPIPRHGFCPLCRGRLDYFFWPLNAFVCPADSAWWSLADALDHQPGHREFC